MIELYQPWNRSWSDLGRPSMSTITLIGKRVVYCCTKSTCPSVRQLSMSSALQRSMTGMNFSRRSAPRKAGVTRLRWREWSRPSICRMVGPCTGSSCHS